MSLVFAGVAGPEKRIIVEIPAGTVIPLLGGDPKKKPLPVSRFWIDRYPVSNRDFFEFTQKQPQWRRGKILTLFSDDNYLAAWTEQGPAPETMDAPVTQVSWFAASAYCKSLGGRLPRTLEWEYVGAADETRPDASRDPAFAQRLLEWYSKPNPAGHELKIGESKPNFYGVSDLHGLVWEWTDDVNSVFVSGDNRRVDDSVKNLFCGAGAEGAANREDYAAFMRYAFRSSLQARYTVSNLGFRCAYDKDLRSSK